MAADAGRSASASAPYEEIATALREDILTGRLRPGTRLVEAELAERFGVSRVPVREALSQLQAEGFASHVRYRGTTVAERSADAAIELMQVRRGLEVLAAQIAARRRGGDVAESLAHVVELGHAAGRERAFDEIPPLVLRFHTLVAEAAGNEQLRLMLSRVLDLVSWVFDQHLESRSEPSWAAHAAIAQAILSGSPVQAGYLMDEHIAKDEELVARLDRT